MNQLPIHPPAEAPERPHAERSASQLKSINLCPGYIPDRKPKKEQHWVTQQGIRGHDALQFDDKGNLQSGYEGHLVQLCEDYCNSLPETILSGDLREIRIDTIEGRWGYIDRLRFRKEGVKAVDDTTIAATIVDLVDYKFVKVKQPEDAEINLQGYDYVVGVFDAFEHVDQIQVHFLAPRFGTVTTATFHRSDVPRLKLEILAILTQAKKTDKKRVSAKLFTPHYETCRFCGRLATCSAVRKIAETVYRRYVDAGHATPLPEVPENVHASQAKDPDVLGRLRLLSTVLESWAQAVQHHTLNAALDDGIVPTGFRIIHRKGKRKITQPLALVTLGPKFGLDVNDILEASTVSVAQLEDKVMASADRGKKEETKNKFLDALRDASALERGEESPALEKINS